VLDERVTVANIALSEKELITARTSFEIAKVTLAAELDKESRLRKLTQGFSVSIDAQQKQYFAVQRAKATVSNAEAIIASNIARLNVAKTSLNLLSVTAPLSGIILDIYMRPGEFININTSAKSVMLVGNIDPLYVKVQIDESDIHRFTSTALATAFLRNNEKITFPLEFVQALPYVTSKTQLNSAMPEIVDTRILYILYKIKTTSHKLYVGQLLDVFIQADNNY
jgi:biotin carboxyl carrier protein